MPNFTPLIDYAAGFSFPMIAVIRYLINININPKNLSRIFHEKWSLDPKNYKQLVISVLLFKSISA